MKIISCIICPNSCSIEVDEKTLETKGNRCPRGHDFAIQELTNPMRTVTSTVRTSFSNVPVIACRTSKAILKNKIMDVMKEINKITINKRLKIGDVIISNIANTGADLIVTSHLLEGEKNE